MSENEKYRLIVENLEAWLSKQEAAIDERFSYHSPGTPARRELKAQWEMIKAIRLQLRKSARRDESEDAR
jgi:hypothetical protein